MSGLGFDLENAAGGAKVAYLGPDNHLVLVITNSTGKTVTLPAADGPPPSEDDQPRAVPGFACYAIFGDLPAPGALAGLTPPEGWWQSVTDGPQPVLALAPRSDVPLRPGPAGALRVPLGP